MDRFVGIDIGSTAAKMAIIDSDSKLIDLYVTPTGWSSIDTANILKSKIEENAISLDQTKVVATGYGRVSVPYANKAITEITCHAKGASFLYEQDDLTVIDIGGQDTKIISIRDGAVFDFAMNDKCSAGTGRFLEVMANAMGVSIEELSNLAAKGGGVKISTMCTVFAESEVVSLVGRGEKRENIAFAVIDSIVDKVSVLCSKLYDGKTACITGGLSECDYIVDMLGEQLKTKILKNKNARFAGAIGAALLAKGIK